MAQESDATNNAFGHLAEAVQEYGASLPGEHTHQR
jgi:hypothetical protein